MTPRRAWPRRWAALAIAAVALIASPRVRAADGLSPIPPAQGFVTDDAHLLSDTRRAQIEDYLAALRAKTGVQFAVLTVDSTAPEDPSQYKVRVVQQWKLGDEKHDEVLLLLVAMKEHRAVFETGYGLEGTMTDTWESGAIDDLLRPRFRAGNYEDGVTAVVLASVQHIAAAKGVTIPWTGEALRYGQGSRREPQVPFIVPLLIFLVLLTLSRLFSRGGRGPWFGGGPWIGGGLGGWGGGFGGGGGGGGGGFGGFGGGGGGFSSGGGGGGGGW